MKKKFKNIINFLKDFLKDKWNIAIIILVLLVIALGITVVGVVKTFTVIGLIIALVLLIRYGGVFIMAKRKRNKRKEITKPKKKWRKIVNFIVISFLILGIIGIIGGFCFMGYIVTSAPKFDKQKLYYKEASIIYDVKGKEITRVGQEMRDKITYNEIPQVFIDAIVATEDSRYFEHNGFDLPRFLKASAGQAIGKSGAGGASTISMQVIKNNFTTAKQDITRKFTDIYLAIFKLEKNYTKEQILEFYVNKIHLGINNTLGISETSRNLFGKEIGDINLSEAALLAGMFQAPDYYNPYRYPDRAKARRSTVLYLMERHGYITNEERKIANSIPIESLLVEKETKQHPYQGYIDYATAEAKTKTGYDPLMVPMKIYTNLNIDKQNYLNDILSGKEFTFENDLVQAGIAVTDINTGAVLALGNGRNRTGKKLYNLATDINCQVGSTAKPLFDYGPGFEYNNWSTYTPFVDDVYTYYNGKEIGNWDNKYFGMLTLRYALGQSRNIPALKAFQQVDNKKIIEFVESLGITPQIENGRIHEAHAIGGFNGASPLQLAVAYAAFANGGYYIEPYSVNKIEFIDTNEVKTYKPEKVRVMSDSTAYMVTDVLRYAVDNRLVGGGKISGIEVAAKTGTTNFDQAKKQRYNLSSNAVNDLWYAGYSPDYAIGMWYGYEKIDSTYHSKSPSSSIVRDKLFSAISKGIFEKNGKKFEMPNSVVKVQVEKGTIPAMLPSKYTPSNMITTEIFKKGTEPTETSPRFNTLPNVTGLDTAKEENKVTLTWNAATAPNMITEEYLRTIASQKDKYISKYQAENDALLGKLGYNVYLKQENGELLLLGWTSNTTFTHTPKTSGSLTYIVKTCYSIFKNSESTGAQITLSSSPYVSLPIANLSTNTITGITYTDSGKKVSVIKETTYVDGGIKVLRDAADVTDKAILDITITNKTTSTTTKVTSIKDIVIDTSIVGEYVIDYKITYEGEEIDILHRTVTIINP